MEDKLNPKDIEQLVEEGRRLLRKAKPSLDLKTAIHFASFPTYSAEPVSIPYALPWYVRRNLQSLTQESI